MRLPLLLQNRRALKSFSSVVRGSHLHEIIHNPIDSGSDEG